MEEENNNNGLEDIIEADEISEAKEWGISAELPEILDLKEYTRRFTKRYQTESSFRKIVHNYLGLTSFGKFKLVLGSWFRPNWYRRKTKEMVTAYAQEVRKGLEKAREIQEQLMELQNAQQTTDQHEEKLKLVDSNYRLVDGEYKQILDEKGQEEEGVIQSFEQKKQKAEEKLAEQQTKIKEQTDARKIVQQKLQNHIRNSSLVQVGAGGRLEFDEQKMTEKLEDLFLKEIVDGIEKEDGRTGFMTKIKNDYASVFSHWAEIDDLSEIPNVDWIQSMIYSRTKGYSAPVFPYLVAGKGSGLSKTSLDTAVILDSSQSMEENDRFEIAKKTALATNALMRKLNPKNSTYLAHFRDRVHEVSSLELLNKVRPTNGTNTHLAIKWLLNTLKDRGPSIAYLITDGYPNDVGAAEKEAKNFHAYPNVLLRIFLIDGDKTSEDIVRQVGKAAGPGTKVIPVKNYQLAGGLIRDVSAAIKGMYAISEF